MTPAAGVTASAAGKVEGCAVLVLVVGTGLLDCGISLVGLLVIVGRIGLREKGCVRSRKRGFMI